MEGSRVIFSSLFAFIFAALSFVQVPQWDNDWKKCSVFVPDTACHWYVVNPDNTFGKGFSWITAPRSEEHTSELQSPDHSRMPSSA